MRLIDADELLRNEVRFRPLNGDNRIGGVASDDIISAPTIAPESLRPVAHWIRWNSSWLSWRCSNCGYWNDFHMNELESNEVYLPDFCPTNYCPNCGAKMIKS